MEVIPHKAQQYRLAKGGLPCVGVAALAVVGAFFALPAKSPVSTVTAMMANHSDGIAGSIQRPEE